MVGTFIQGPSAHALALAKIYGSAKQAHDTLWAEGWHECDGEAFTRRELEEQIDYRARVMSQLRTAQKLGLG